jgi:hypothetical protein
MKRLPGGGRFVAPFTLYPNLLLYFSANRVHFISLFSGNLTGI